MLVDTLNDLVWTKMTLVGEEAVLYSTDRKNFLLLHFQLSWTQIIFDLSMMWYHDYSEGRDVV